MLTFLLLVAALTLLAAGWAIWCLAPRAVRWVHLRCVDGRVLLVQAPVSWDDERSTWLTLLALFRFTFSSARSRRMQLCDVGQLLANEQALAEERFQCRGTDARGLIVQDDDFPIADVK